MGTSKAHLTYNDRLRLEALLKAKTKKEKIAEILHCNISTVYREIKRGQFEALNGDYTTEMRYSPDIAQQHADEVLASKGPGLKIAREYEFANRIEEIIIKDGYSPAAALAKAADEGIEFTVCVTTLYSYIEKGVFLDLTLKNLPMRGREKDKKRHKRKVQKRASRGESIESRPREIELREEFGHWEMDTVMGKQGVSQKSLLVLTERKTRKEIVFMMKEHTSAEVVRCLNRLERSIGAPQFREVFKSITVDNGTEFSDCKGMERSKRNKNTPRTKLFYCHPYSSYERGSNENQNKLIRRHIPKGTDFDNLTQGDADRIGDWMNNYPRLIFGYRSAEELYIEEINKLTG